MSREMLTKIIIALVTFCVCPSVMGAVSISVAWRETTSGHSATDGLVVPAATDRCLVFFGTYEEVNSGHTILASLSLGGVSLTNVGYAEVGTASFRVGIEIWILKDADIPADSNNFTMVWVGANNPESYSWNFAVFEGVDQTTPISDTAFMIDNSTYTGGTITLDVTTGSYTIALGAASSSGRTFTWTNTTEVYELALGGNSAFSGALADNAEGSDGTNAITQTISSGATRGLLLGCTVAPAANGEPAVDISYVRRIKEGEGK